MTALWLLAFSRGSRFADVSLLLLYVLSFGPAFWFTDWDNDKTRDPPLARRMENGLPAFGGLNLA